MPESLFNKVTGLYLTILLKEKTLIHVFSDQLCEIFKIHFLQSISRRLLLFYIKIFYQQIKKNLLTSILHILLLFKNFFLPSLTAFHDTLKALAFRKKYDLIEDLSLVENYFLPSVI